MSRKTKEAVVWFRFKFADTAAGRMQIQRAADRLFRLACVSERRTYTEEEVVRMVKAALEKAEAERHICWNCQHGTQWDSEGDCFCTIKQEYRCSDFGETEDEDCEDFEQRPEEEDAAAQAAEAPGQAMDGRCSPAVPSAERVRVFSQDEILEARDQRASITITQTNTDELPRVRIEWPAGEVSEGVLKQDRTEVDAE